MIPIPPFNSCLDQRYIFSKGLNIQSCSVGKPLKVYVNGGRSPYTWYITGDAFALEFANTVNQYNSISTTENVIVGESVEEITVTDACGNEIDFLVQCCDVDVCCEDPNYSFSCEEFLDNPFWDYSLINVYGGCPPFLWETDNIVVGHFPRRYTEERHNIIYFPNTDEFENLGYSVTDLCGNTVNGTIAYAPWEGNKYWEATVGGWGGAYFRQDTFSSVYIYTWSGSGYTIVLKPIGNWADDFIFDEVKISGFQLLSTGLPFIASTYAMLANGTTTSYPYVVRTVFTPYTSGNISNMNLTAKLTTYGQLKSINLVCPHAFAITNVEFYDAYGVKIPQPEST